MRGTFHGNFIPRRHLSSPHILRHYEMGSRTKCEMLQKTMKKNKYPEAFNYFSINNSLLNGMNGMFVQLSIKSFS